MASEAPARPSAISAPFQYGLEESADQKTCVSKLASTSLRRYFTVLTGILNFVAIFASVPSERSIATPSAIC